MKTVEAGVLSVAYHEAGPAHGKPVFLLHGFPYDIHAYDDVVPILVAADCRVIVPYLRGYGPTGFLSTATPRSGQQAVLAHDLIALMDALAIPSAVLAGYDWGGRAACIVAALWPERAGGLVTGNGYNIQNIAAATKPADPVGRTSILVSILLPQRARPCRARAEPLRLLQAVVAALVAELDLR